MSTATVHPITAYRIEHGMTATRFAEWAGGLDKTVLSKVENGHRNGFSTPINKLLSELSGGELSFESLECWEWSKSKSKGSRAAERARNALARRLVSPDGESTGVGGPKKKRGAA